MSPALREVRGDLTLYRAGMRDKNPNSGFPSNFNRDGILSGILIADPIMLGDQLKFGAALQANHKDPRNGAEEGKPHHEHPGVEIRGLSTEFNACDAAAWFLMGFEAYQKLTGDISLARDHRGNIKRAADYILNHLSPGYLFTEDPQFAGADNFALKVTYWKDSALPGRPNGEPDYPIVYTLAHGQNTAGLRAGASLLGSRELGDVADRMVSATQRLYNANEGTFYTAIDRGGPVPGKSSDSLNMLFFLNPGDITVNQISAVIQSAGVLETVAGYRTLDPDTAQTMFDQYHASTVWPVENATIHQGARRFRKWAEENKLSALVGQLRYVERVSARPMNYLRDNNAETFVVNGDNVKNMGCDPQLWTEAAKDYFDSVKAA